MNTKEPRSPENLTDNTDQGRFELHREEDLVGWLYYTHLRPNRYALRHTEVEPSHQHPGYPDRATAEAAQRQANN